MIQRIQSLYLLAVAALMIAATFTPLAYFVGGVEEYKLFAFSLKSAEVTHSTIYMGIIVALSAIVPTVTIFLFKNRMLQVRLCAVEIVVLLGCIAFMAIYFWLSGANALEAAVVEHRQFGWAAIMPIVALVLVSLAARATFKDEVLVRSLDRIR